MKEKLLDKGAFSVRIVKIYLKKEDMKITDTLRNWLDERKLSMTDLLCLAFVPTRTWENIRDGISKPFGASDRLYIITGLKEFELTPSELQKHKADHRRYAQAQIDEKIARAFLKRWKEEGILPTGKNERLILPGNVKQHKDELTRLLMKTLLHENSDSPSSGSLFSDLIVLIEKELAGTPDEFKAFIKAHKSEISNLASILNVILTENPQDAIQKLKQLKQFFSSDKKIVTDGKSKS